MIAVVEFKEHNPTSNIFQTQTVVIEEQRASSEIFLAPAVVDPGSLPSVRSHFTWMNTSFVKISY